MQPPQTSTLLMPSMMEAPWVPKFKGSDNEDSYEEWQGQIQFMIQNTNADSTTIAGVSNGALKRDAKREFTYLARC